MAPKASTFRRNVILMVTAACVVRAGIGIVSWQNVENLEAASLEVGHSLEILGALESVRSGLERSVSLERAYLISGLPSSLEDVAEAQRRTRQSLAILWELASVDLGPRPLVADLAPLVDARFAASDSIVETRRRSGLAAARELVLAGRGAAQMTAALAKIDAASDAERRLLRDRSLAQRAKTTRALNGIAFVAVLSMLVLIAVAVWLLPAFDERVAVRDALRPAALRK